MRKKCSIRAEWISRKTDGGRRAPTDYKRHHKLDVVLGEDKSLSLHVDESPLLDCGGQKWDVAMKGAHGERIPT